ncbi:hypothetical protein ABZ547_01545 [Streptomyces sparsogenes]|uniref:hypothetical protein n=1 Tax=Streptomyces sparsogenes TaxID=67365 RepID=UPI0033F4806C
MIAVIVVVFVLAVACFTAAARTSPAPTGDAVLSRRAGWLLYGVVLVGLGLYLVNVHQERTWSDGEVGAVAREAAEAVDGDTYSSAHAVRDAVDDALRRAAEGKGAWEELQVLDRGLDFTVFAEEDGPAHCIRVTTTKATVVSPGSIGSDARTTEGVRASATVSGGRCQPHAGS